MRRARIVGIPLCFYWGMTLAAPLLNGRPVDPHFIRHATVTLGVGAALGLLVFLVVNKK